MLGIAAIGVRGTTVWGGPIDNGYGVVVLSGEVTVTARRGPVTLKQGQGTMLFGDRQTPAGGRLARRPYEARRRLNHLREFAGSTVGEPEGAGLPQRPAIRARPSAAEPHPQSQSLTIGPGHVASLEVRASPGCDISSPCR